MPGPTVDRPPPHRPHASEQVDVIIAASVSVRARLRGVLVARIEAKAASASPDVLWSEVQLPVTAAWDDIAALQRRLEPHAERYAKLLSSESPGDDDPLAFALATSLAPASSERPRGTLDDRLGESAWSTSFILHREIDGFRKRLVAVLRLDDGWELVDALQEHVARLGAALEALEICLAVLSSATGGSELASDIDAQLTISRELRGRLFDLRDAVLEIERSLQARPASEWHDALMDARRRVDRFMLSPGFNWLWATDKRAFLRQRTALDEILQLWSPLRAEPARHAVAGLARYLEAMEVINRRECLVAHDLAALERAVTYLDECGAADGPEAREAVSAALASLASAQGRDREIDRLLAESLKPDEELPLEALRAQVHQVVGELRQRGR